MKKDEKMQAMAIAIIRARNQAREELSELCEHAKFCYLCNTAPKLCICRKPQYAVHENIWKKGIKNWRK